MIGAESPSLLFKNTQNYYIVTLCRNVETCLATITKHIIYKKKYYNFIEKEN